MAVNVSTPQVCLKVVQSARECVEHVLCMQESMASVQTLQEWYKKCGNVPECARVLQV